MSTRYLSAKEAAAELDVSLATLYAYVSRGLVRSEAAAGSRRTRRYRRDDIARLKARQDQRRSPARAAQQILHWGLPVLESRLSLIADGQLYYRGQNAVALALSSTFEQVAELLWLGTLPERIEVDSRWPAAAASQPDSASWLRQLSMAAPVERMQALLFVAGGRDTAAFDLRPAGVVEAARRILYLSLAAAIYPAKLTGQRLAKVLQTAWAPDDLAALPIIESALILCADHELNVSAFTGRCVASAGGTPYGVVVAALSALQGVRHGGAVGRAKALLEEIDRPARTASVLSARLRRGDAFPGFGHPLYPEGDPRGRALLALVAAARPRSKAVRLATTLTAEVAGLISEEPTVDLALAVTETALGLPSGAGLALFALGRTAGWIAHALEQYATGEMIRPRATYVGVSPDVAS
jgi:citrate synthase